MNGVNERKAIFLKPVIIIIFLILIANLFGCVKNPGASVLNKGMINELEEALDEVYTENNIPGMVVAIRVEGEKDWISNRGVGNIETNEAMKADNHFRIGSITKTFTGTVLLQLVDEGLIELDKPISFYLPEYKIPKGEIITVRMLGNMTSGISNYSEDGDFIKKAMSFETYFTSNELINYGIKNKLLFEPSTDWYYSNTNTVILRVLCEKVTGKTYKELINERIIKKLKLKNTIVPESRFLPVPYSHGYSIQEITGVLCDASFGNPSWADAAGIIISDVSDLLIYVKALGNGDLISKKSMEERCRWINKSSFNSSMGKDTGYGFCLGKWSVGWLGHNGSIPGYNTEIMYNPEKKISIVILVNSDIKIPGKTGPADEVRIKLLDIFTRIK